MTNALFVLCNIQLVEQEQSDASSGLAAGRNRARGFQNKPMYALMRVAFILFVVTAASLLLSSRASTGSSNASSSGTAHDENESEDQRSRNRRSRKRRQRGAAPGDGNNTRLHRYVRKNGRVTISAPVSLLQQVSSEQLEQSCGVHDRAKTACAQLLSAAPDVYVVCKVRSDAAEERVADSLTRCDFPVPKHRMLFCEQAAGKQALVRAIAPAVHVEDEPEIALELARFIDTVVLVGCSQAALEDTAHKMQSKHAHAVELTDSFAHWVHSNSQPISATSAPHAAAPEGENRELIVQSLAAASNR